MLLLLNQSLAGNVRPFQKYSAEFSWYEISWGASPRASGTLGAHVKETGKNIASFLSAESQSKPSSKASSWKNCERSEGLNY